MSTSLKVVMVDGTESVHLITPLIEYNFELQFKDGILPTLAKQRNSDVYWLAWECLRQAGTVVPPFGPEFLKLIASADFADEVNRPNG